MKMNNNIKDAMRTSDFNEIVLRVNELQRIMWNMVRSPFPPDMVQTASRW